MDIHDLSNNLGENDKTDEISEFFTDKPDEVIKQETSQEADIHDAEETDKSESMSTKLQKPVFKLAPSKKNIMGNVMQHKAANLNAKQMIKAGRIVKPSPPHKTINKYKPSRQNMITSHSYGNHLRADPEITNEGFPLPQVTKAYSVTYLRNDILDDFDMKEISDSEWMQIACGGRGPILPSGEKPKEINLAEIVTGVLQDVLCGKLDNIDNIIGKLRINYEEKNLFANKQKRNIILINFEDDTMRPVLKIDDKYMGIIEKWYESCDLLIDIEETNVSIPENITAQDVSGVLFQDINYKHKDDYLNNYIPLIINNVISSRYIKDIQRKLFVNPTITPFLKQNEKPTESNKIKEMGIIVPPNINLGLDLTPTEVSKEEMKQVFYISPNIDKSIKQKDIFIDTRTSEIHDSNDCVAYNDIFVPLTNDINNSINMFTPYNVNYDCLQPRFAENSLIIDDFEIAMMNEKNKQKDDSIYVLIHDKFLQTFTIKNPDKDSLYAIKNHQEFGFAKLFNYKTANNDIINFIEREYNNVLFNDIDEVNKKLLVTSQYFDFANKQNSANLIATTEENQVKKFLNSKYEVDDDINHKMKASTLYDIIINAKAVKIDADKMAGFKTRLSKYLKDMGLQKKRYNDGFYYYGIVEKKPLYDITERQIPINIYDIVEKRAEELNSYKHVLPSTSF